MAGNPLERVLIIQTAFLGDVILATGIVEKIHQHFPEAGIDVLVRKGNESLFEDHPYIRQVIVFDKNQRKYLNLIRLIFRLKREKYDLVANIQRYFTTGLITAMSGGIITIGFDKNPLSFLFSKKIKHEFGDKHEIERNHELIAWFTDNRPGKPRLYPGQDLRNKVSDLTGDPYFCLAPASVWFTKQFPESRWVELIGLLPENHRIFLIGGPGDRDLCTRIAGRSGRSGVDVMAGQLSLLETAALMGGARANIVNDSAPMHIASAMNAPVCAIYCSTLPSFGYGPLSDRSDVVELKKDLYCRPCGIHGRKKCPEGHFRCAMDIPLQQILDSVNALLK